MDSEKANLQEVETNLTELAPLLHEGSLAAGQIAIAASFLREAIRALSYFHGGGLSKP